MEQTKIELTDAEARELLVAQRKILAAQNDAHRINQQAQQAIAQCSQREQAAQKAYGELVTKMQTAHDCAGLPLDTEGLFFTKE